jgi:hypothetical protein
VNQATFRDGVPGILALSAAERRWPFPVSWLPFSIAVAAAMTTTLAVPLIAPLQFAYPAPSLRVALDTGGALIGLLATAIGPPSSGPAACGSAADSVPLIASVTGTAVTASAAAAAAIVASTAASGPR